MELSSVRWIRWLPGSGSPNRDGDDAAASRDGGDPFHQPRVTEFHFCASPPRSLGGLEALHQASLKRAAVPLRIRAPLQRGWSGLNGPPLHPRDRYTTVPETVPP